MPMRFSVRAMRQAIAPRLAIRILSNIASRFRNGRHAGHSGFPRSAAARSRVVGIAGIVQLRTVRDQADDVHFGAHFDVLAGAETPFAKLSPPSGVTGTFIKKLMLAAMSASS